jgi:hypothetical protein
VGLFPLCGIGLRFGGGKASPWGRGRCWLRGMTTDKPVYLGVFAFFEEVPEPRVERTRLHPLPNILIIALLAMICVGEGWEDMEEFGLAKKRVAGNFFGSASRHTER